MAEVFSIVNGLHPNVPEWIKEFQKKNSDTVPYFVNYDLNHIFFGILKGKPWGFFSAKFSIGRVRSLRINATCIKYGKRSIKYGQKLIQNLEEYARKVDATKITVKVPSDIMDADDFWKSVGFSCVAVIDGGASRSRKLNIWEKPLKKFLFETGSIEPIHSKIKRVHKKKPKPVAEEEPTGKLEF